MRPYLITSVAAFIVVLISLVGMARERLPSIAESARYAALTVMLISFVVDSGYLLSA